MNFPIVPATNHYVRHSGPLGWDQCGALTKRVRSKEEHMLARQIAIGFGIAIIFPLLVYYGLSSFHPAPRMADFVGNTAAFKAAAREFSRLLISVATPLGIAAILIGS